MAPRTKGKKPEGKKPLSRKKKLLIAAVVLASAGGVAVAVKTRKKAPQNPNGKASGKASGKPTGKAAGKATTAKATVPALYRLEWHAVKKAGEEKVFCITNSWLPTLICLSISFNRDNEIDKLVLHRDDGTILYSLPWNSQLEGKSVTAHANVSGVVNVPRNVKNTAITASKIDFDQATFETNQAENRTKVSLRLRLGHLAVTHPLGTYTVDDTKGLRFGITFLNFSRRLGGTLKIDYPQSWSVDWWWRLHVHKPASTTVRILPRATGGWYATDAKNLGEHHELAELRYVFGFGNYLMPTSVEDVEKVFKD